MTRCDLDDATFMDERQMSEDADHGASERFRPLRPASKPKLILALVLGPLLWFAAFVVVAIVVVQTYAVELGMLITAGAFAVSFVTLILLRWTREREERRYVDR
jgi:hypothetical protein